MEIKQRSFIVYLLDKSSFSRIYLFTCAAFYSVKGRGKSFLIYSYLFINFCGGLTMFDMTLGLLQWRSYVIIYCVHVLRGGGGLLSIFSEFDDERTQWQAVL